MFLRLFLIKDLIHMRMKVFVMEVYLKIAMVTFTALVIPVIICFIQTDSLVRLFEISILGTLSVALSVYYLGLSVNERTKIIHYIKNRS